MRNSFVEMQNFAKGYSGIECENENADEFGLLRQMLRGEGHQRSPKLKNRKRRHGYCPAECRLLWKGRLDRSKIELRLDRVFAGESGGNRLACRSRLKSCFHYSEGCCRRRRCVWREYKLRYHLGQWEISRYRAGYNWYSSRLVSCGQAVPVCHQ